MKKILYIALVALFAFSSCELERRPHNGYTPDDLYEDPEAAFELMLTGVYGQMKGMVDAHHRTGEYPGDNIAKHLSTTDAMSVFITYNHAPGSNGRTKNIWDNSYKIISQTSTLMTMVDEATATPQRKYQLGEAYYLRGLSYFYLCRVYGMPYYQSPETNLAVPIINDKPENVLAAGLTLPDRSTVKQVYDQAISDLKKAEELMNQPSVTKNNNYASKEAAQAMLSRIYLYMSGTFENPNTQYADLAIEYAQKVIDSERFEMLSRADFMNYNVTLPENNKETIFAVKRTDTDIRNNPGHGNTFGAMYSNAGGQGWNEIFASAKYAERLRVSGNDNVNVFGPTAADARGSFIRPYYTGLTRQQVENGVIPTGTDFLDKFYAVVDSYSADGILADFAFLEMDVRRTTSGGWEAGSRKEDKSWDDSKPVYPLTERDGRYVISYQPANAPAAREYVGDITKAVTLKGKLYMWPIYKSSLEGGLQQVNSPVISRMAELYLNLAEAYAKKGDLDNALTNINIVRNRAVVDNPITMEQMTANAVKVIDNERTLELAWEGHRGFDAFRLGLTMDHRYPAWMGAINGVETNLVPIPATHPFVVQLIDQATIDAYSLYGELTQNPVEALPAPDRTPYSPFIPY